MATSLHKNKDYIYIFYSKNGASIFHMFVENVFRFKKKEFRIITSALTLLGAAKLLYSLNDHICPYICDV